jgi:lipoyl(octanoyl) transferase
VQKNINKLVVHFQELGLMDYKTAWDYQEKLLQKNITIKQAQRNAEINNLPYKGAETESYFLYVTHPPVYTLGKSGNENNVLLSAIALEKQNIQYYKTNRGGDITYHGPGQIVGYPILDLEKIKADIVWYMRSLEEVIINTLAQFDIVAGRLEGETGVWLQPENKIYARKICAMGVRTSRWITMHGFALNVNTDLNYFKNIIPCGIADKGVTSMEKELGFAQNEALVKTVLIQEFEKSFGVSITI